MHPGFINTVLLFTTLAAAFVPSPLPERASLVDRESSSLLLPPPPFFPTDVWDPVKDADLIKHVIAAYHEAFQMASYVSRKAHREPLNTQAIPKLYFPEDALKVNGTVETVLSFFELQRGEEDYSNIFHNITFLKGYRRENCAHDGVVAYLSVNRAFDQDTPLFMTFCEGTLKGDVFVEGSPSTRICKRMCGSDKMSWASLSTTILHELFHLNAVGRKGPGFHISDFPIDSRELPEMKCGFRGAYGPNCCYKLNKYHPEIALRNADSYTWMVVEQIVHDRCGKSPTCVLDKRSDEKHRSNVADEDMSDGYPLPGPIEYI